MHRHRAAGERVCDSLEEFALLGCYGPTGLDRKQIRQELVEKIIEAERLEAEPNVREPLLRAAQAIVDAPRAAGAKKRLEERLEVLKARV